MEREERIDRLSDITYKLCEAVDVMTTSYQDAEMVEGHPMIDGYHAAEQAVVRQAVKLRLELGDHFSNCEEATCI